MRKWLTTLLCIAMVFCFFSCEKGGKADNYDIAMITDTDTGTIDDKSFNQATWEGLEEYAKSNDITYKYYQPTEDSNDARLEQVDLAVKNGAKIIVTTGILFETAIFTAQDKYPEINFILIDGNPNDGNTKDPNYKTADNTVGITFEEQEAGYLAGYAAVKSGYTKLGFMGGMKVPSVMRYGYGFIYGANDAAKKLNTKVNIKYNYAGDFNASSNIKSKAATWYADGTEVIFSCGGLIFDSVSAAAEESKNGKVIGVDVDQSSQSQTVITSAMKGLAVAVKEELDAFYKDQFPGGENLVLGAKDNAIGLPMDSSKFNNFTKEDYKEVFDKVKAGKIEIPTDKRAKNVKKLVDKAKLDNIRISIVQ